MKTTFIRRNSHENMTRWAVRVSPTHHIAVEFRDGKFNEFLVYVCNDGYNWTLDAEVRGGTLRDAIKGYAQHRLSYHEFIAIFKK